MFADFYLHVVAADEKGVAFFERAAETKAGGMQTADSYFDSVKPSLERPNVVALGTDDPPVMRSMRKQVTDKYPKVITGACGWHKTDNACPIEVGTVKQAIADTKVVSKFWRNRGVPAGILRKAREQHNKEERNTATLEKRKIKCVPTLKVKILTYFNSRGIYTFTRNTTNPFLVFTDVR